MTARSPEFPGSSNRNTASPDARSDAVFLSVVFFFFGGGVDVYAVRASQRKVSPHTEPLKIKSD